MLVRFVTSCKTYFKHNSHAVPGNVLMSKLLKGNARDDALTPDIAILALVANAEKCMTAMKASGRGRGLTVCPKEMECDNPPDKSGCWAWAPDDPEPMSDEDRCNRRLHPKRTG
jgi:hypothetical protein